MYNRQWYLNKELKDYLREHKEFTKEEVVALKDWVAAGYSVHENASLAVYEGGSPLDFIDVWRDEEYIRQHTKGMTPEETRHFALAYYGWEDVYPEDVGTTTLLPKSNTINEVEELPF